MKTQIDRIDPLAIELEARRLRAQVLRSGFIALRGWFAARRTAAHSHA